MFTKNHIKLGSINSTNDYALSLQDSPVFKEGLVITANHQSMGNGQRGRVWESNDSENLLISVVIEPKIELKRQYQISKTVSLSVIDLLKTFGIRAYIKWPNDILVEKKKIAGILIQNKSRGNYISHSIIGLGFNVNQILFKKYSPNATSLNLLTNKEFKVFKIKQLFLSFLSKRLKLLKDGKNQDNEYFKSLFLKDKLAVFEVGEEQFAGTIKGVSESGELQIKHDKNSITSFKSQEVKYLF